MEKMITPEWLEFSKHGVVAHHGAVCLWQTEVLSSVFPNVFQRASPNGFSQMDSGDKSDKRGNGSIWRVRSEHDVNEMRRLQYFLLQYAAADILLCRVVRRQHAHRLLMVLRLPRLCLKVKRQHLALSLASFIGARGV